MKHIESTNHSKRDKQDLNSAIFANIGNLRWWYFLVDTNACASNAQKV